MSLLSQLSRRFSRRPHRPAVSRRRATSVSTIAAEVLEDRVLLSGDPGVSVDIEAPYTYRFGATGAQLNEDFFNEDNPDSWFSRGYVPDMIREYHNGSQVLFSTRWSQGVGARKSNFGMSLEELNERRAELEPDWQLFDIDAHTRPNGEVRFAAVWTPNPDGEYFELHPDQSGTELDALIDILEPQDLWPTRVAAYEQIIDDVLQTRYISLWKPAGGQWYLYGGRTPDEYQTLIDDEDFDDFRVVHVDLTTNPAGNLRFSVIFHGDPTATQRIQTNRDWYLHQRNFNNNSADGYVIENIVATDIPEGADPANPRSRLGGIWSFDSAPQLTSESSLAAKIRQIVDSAPGRAGAAIINLDTGEEILVHGDQTFSTQSTIKIAILYSLLKAHDAGDIDFNNDSIPMLQQYGTNQPTVGTGLIATGANPNTHPLSYVAAAMVSRSNNWATNRLIDLLGAVTGNGNQSGFQVVNSNLDELGLSTIRLNRYMLGTGAPSVDGNANSSADFNAGIQNKATPRQFVELLRKLRANEHDGDALLGNGSYNNLWQLLRYDRDNVFAATMTHAPGGINDRKGNFDNLFVGAFGSAFRNNTQVFSKDGSVTPGWILTPDATDLDNDGNTTEQAFVNNANFGDYAHVPQLQGHINRSEAGVFVLPNGTEVALAVFIDEGDGPRSQTTAPTVLSPNEEAIKDVIECTAYHVAAEYGGPVVDFVPAECAFEDGRILRIGGRSANDEIVVRQNPTNPGNIDVFVAIDLTPGVGNYDVSFGTPVFTVAAANVDSIVVDGAGGEDYIDILSLPMPIPIRVEGGGDDDLIRVNVPATVNGGAGADEIIIGNGDLDNIGGTVSVNGQASHDTLIIDDSLHPGNETYTISSAAVTRTGLPLFAFSYSGIESLEVEGGTSSNTFEVDGTADGVDVTVTGGPLNDTFQVGNGDIDSNLGNGLLHIVGGANGDDGDHLILEDTGDAGNKNYTFDDDEFSKSNYLGTLTFDGMERVTLDANHDNNQVHVLRTPLGTGLTINVGSGTNTVFAGNGDFDTNIRGDLTVNGAFGFDRFVILDDLDNIGNDQYVFNGPAGSSPATFDKTSYNWVTSYSSFVNSVELEASDFNNTVLLNGAGVGAAVTLNMNFGDDDIHVGNGMLDDFAEMIAIDGGAGVDDVTLHDETDAGNDTYWVGNNFALKSTGFSLSYENAESFTLNANPDQNTINVESVLATTPMWINAGASSDTIHLTPTAQQLSFIHAAVHVNGQDGVDNVFLHDELSNPLDPLPFAVTDDQVVRPLPPFRVSRFELNYEELERLVLQLGAADDLVDVQSTAPGMHVVVESGFGEDTVLADVPTPAQLTFDGGADDDTVQLVGTAAAEEVSVSIGFGVADVNLISFEDASIDLAGGTDVLVYQGAPGVDEQVEVHATTNAHAGTLSVLGMLDLVFQNTEIIDLLANPGDLDTAAFVGTDQDDRFEIHLEAAGTNTDPVLQLFELDGVAPLLTLRDYRNFGTLQVRGEDGADLFNVYALPSGPGTGRNLSVDGGSPSGPGNPKDELNVYREFEQPPPPPNPGSNPGNESEGSIDVLYELFEFLIDFSEFEKVKVLSNNAAP